MLARVKIKANQALGAKYILIRVDQILVLHLTIQF